MADKTPAPTVPAATVLLLRDGAEGLEVFMVVRHHQIDFASGALVFPGGKADAQDFEERLRSLSHGGNEDDALFGAQVATIREAFEECGILLATDTATGATISGERLRTLQEFRQPINDGELGFADFLEREGLTLQCDALGHFAHWITPEMMPKRFDTHFFLAAAPADQLAVHDGYESVDSVWITPSGGTRRRRGWLSHNHLSDAAEHRETRAFRHYRRGPRWARRHPTISCTALGRAAR